MYMASRSLNRIEIIGNLTRDPELKYTPAGTAVCTFGVATNRSWTTADGQIKEDTQYHRIVAWQKLAELCGKLLVKGRKVYAVGRITYRTFTGKDGQQRSITEIVLDDFIVFYDNKRATSEEGQLDIKAGEAAGSEDHPPPPSDIEPEGTKKKEETVSADDIPF